MADAALRELRRGQIIAAARRLVASGGLEALTISALEGKLDFTRGVITHHFESKDEIVEAVLDSAIHEIDAATGAAIRAGTTVEDKVRALLHATVRGFIEHREAGRILLSFWGKIPGDARATVINARLYAGYRAYCTKLVAGGVASGAFRKGVSPEAFAALLVAIVIGVASQVYFEPGSIDPDAAVEAGVASVLAGLRAASGSAKAPLVAARAAGSKRGARRAPR